MHGPMYIKKIQAELLSTWSRHTIHRNRGATAITVPYTAHGYFLQRRYIKHPNVSNCISRCISADIPQLLHVDHLQAFSRCSPRPLYLYYCRIYGRINIIPTPPPFHPHQHISVTEVLPTFEILTAVLRCTCNVTLKHVRVTIVTVEKQ